MATIRNRASKAPGWSDVPSACLESPLARGSVDLGALLPKKLQHIRNHQTQLPRIAKDPALTAQIDSLLRSIPTAHDIYCRDARDLSFLPDQTVHLVLTSPPYWTLKEYRRSPGQLGFVADYEEFLAQLDEVWGHCFRLLVPSGRLIIVVGDVCLSRRKNRGRHTVVPLHASIQEHCRLIGFDNLAPIIWHKIANASFEVENGSGFLGKPYEPNAVIKNDIEFILMQRKPGPYRSPSVPTRVLSVISDENHKKWFRQLWTDLPGASTREHPAPFPLELAHRLIRMFSFVQDTVLDPFMGTGTANLAAAHTGRNSVGVDIDPQYFQIAQRRLDETLDLFGTTIVHSHGPGQGAAPPIA